VAGSLYNGMARLYKKTSRLSGRMVLLYKEAIRLYKEATRLYNAAIRLYKNLPRPPGRAFCPYRRAAYLYKEPSRPRVAAFLLYDFPPESYRGTAAERCPVARIPGTERQGRFPKREGSSLITSVELDEELFNALLCSSPGYEPFERHLGLVVARA
jgi:hypothetical protein